MEKTSGNVDQQTRPGALFTCDPRESNGGHTGRTASRDGSGRVVQSGAMAWNKRVRVWDPAVSPSGSGQGGPEATKIDTTYNLIAPHVANLSPKHVAYLHAALQSSVAPETKFVRANLCLIATVLDSFAFKFVANALIAHHLFNNVRRHAQPPDLTSQEFSDAIAHYADAVYSIAAMDHLPPQLLPHIKSLWGDMLILTNTFLN